MKLNLFICLLLPCIIGFFKTFTIPVLLHKMNRLLFFILKSSIVCLIYRSWVQWLSLSIYATFVVDNKEIQFCFLPIQETKKLSMLNNHLRYFFYPLHNLPNQHIYNKEHLERCYTIIKSPNNIFDALFYNN